MTENDVNPPINNGPMEKRNKFVDHPSYIFKSLFQPKYSYLLLDSVQPNTKVNVYGVVKFAKQPYKSRGSGKCCEK